MVVTHIELGYGFFPGGDPRDFTPDEECCSPEELENHRLACEAWDQGNQEVMTSGCIVERVWMCSFEGCNNTFLGMTYCHEQETVQVTRLRNISRFGLGSYSFECDCDEGPEDD